MGAFSEETNEDRQMHISCTKVVVATTISVAQKATTQHHGKRLVCTVPTIKGSIEGYGNVTQIVGAGGLSA